MNLKNISDPGWDKTYKSYLSNLNCPFQIRREQIDWLLAKAIETKFSSNKQYKQFTAKSQTAAKSIPARVTEALIAKV